MYNCIYIQIEVMMSVSQQRARCPKLVRAIYIGYLAKSACQYAFIKEQSYKALKRRAVTLNACSEVHSQLHSRSIRITVVD